MGKFKEFLITEDIGLADIGPRLDRFYNSSYLDSKVNGAFSTGSNAKESPTLGMADNMPDTALSIPSVERTGRIVHLINKRNPIYIRLSDGTEAHFSYDEYRRIEGKPEIGKTMTLIFQRHPEDKMKEASKIDKAIVRD
jgi:hypothetical protein